MQKQTISLIIICVACVTVLGLGGEYFMYQYALSASQKTPVQVSDTLPAASPPVIQGAWGSSENAITAFDVARPLAVGTIDQQNHAITLTLPPDTDVTNLAPVVIVSKDATVAPASGAPQDFMDPVTYTVTAQNGATQTYVVTVRVASSILGVEKLITEFSLLGFTTKVDGFINQNTFAIYVVVPDGTDVAKLTPVIKISLNATVSPKSGAAQNFTNPVIYTVKDVYGTSQVYTVTVVTESDSG